MKPLPKGNYALCIAHPGHELRLHGFLEQAKPFVWILTDGSIRTGQDMMMDSIKAISRAIKQGIKTDPKDNSWNRVFCYTFPDNPEQFHINYSQIYLEILQRTDFFISYIDFISNNLIKYKIDYLIADASEGTNVCHEMMRIMADLSIALVKKKTGKHIFNYDFSIDKPFNKEINEDCIFIQLDEEAIDRKLEAMIKFTLALTDLKPNISLDYNLIIELSKMNNGKEQIKQFLKELNPDFLKYEYLRPYTFSEPTENNLYETLGEKSVAAGKYTEVITYEKHLKPLKEKLHQLILGNAN